jgi:hypothetical protein
MAAPFLIYCYLITSTHRLPIIAFDVLYHLQVNGSVKLEEEFFYLEKFHAYTKMA